MYEDRKERDHQEEDVGTINVNVGLYDSMDGELHENNNSVNIDNNLNKLNSEEIKQYFIDLKTKKETNENQNTKVRKFAKFLKNFLMETNISCKELQQCLIDKQHIVQNIHSTAKYLKEFAFCAP